MSRRCDVGHTQHAHLSTLAGAYAVANIALLIIGGLLSPLGVNQRTGAERAPLTSLLAAFGAFASVRLAYSYPAYVRNFRFAANFSMHLLACAGEDQV